MTNYFTTEEIRQLVTYDLVNNTQLLDKIYTKAKNSPPGTYSMPRLQQVVERNFTGFIPRTLIRRVTILTETETVTKYKKNRKKRKKKRVKKTVIVEEFECLICCTGGEKVKLKCCKQELCLECLGKIQKCPYCRKHF